MKKISHSRLWQLVTALVLFSVLTIQPLAVFADSWSSSEFRVEVGSLIIEEQVLTVAANESGQILVSVPVEGLSLDNNSKVSLTFTGQPPPQIFVVWQTDRSNQHYQKGFYSAGSQNPGINMTGTEGWSGTVTSLEFGFITRPGTQVKLQGARLFQPGITDRLQDVLNNWSEPRTWKLFDNNLYTGVQQFSEGPFPAQFFATLGFVFLAIYLLLRRGRASWHGTGIIIFCVWLALDSFWHLQLWHQVINTRNQYGGLSSHEKISASEDVQYAKFADSVQRIIDRADARVFVAGSQDLSLIHI